MRPTPHGPQRHQGTPAARRAAMAVAESTDGIPAAFDVWFKRQLADVTGVDLNIPPPRPLSRLVSHYEATA